MKQFLKNRYTKDNYTHSSIIPGGTYRIKPQSLDLFYLHYYNYTFRDLRPIRMLERRIYPTPLTIDLDFYQSRKERQLTDNILDQILSVFHQEINNIWINPNFDYYLMMRPSPYSKGNLYKDGIHLIYPNIITNLDSFNRLRTNLLPQLAQILKDLQFTNSIYQIFDDMSIKVHWELYGSRGYYQEPYQLMRSNYEFDLKSKLFVLSLIKKLSIHSKKDKTHYLFGSNGLNKVQNLEKGNVIDYGRT